LIATTVATCRAVSISPFYQQQVGSIKFTAGVTYTYVPKGTETPTGEGDAGGLRVLTDNYLYLIFRIADVSRSLMELSVPEPPRAEFQTYLAQS
jgi:hypothetical protein